MYVYLKTLYIYIILHTYKYIVSTDSRLVLPVSPATYSGPRLWFGQDASRSTWQSRFTERGLWSCWGTARKPSTERKSSPPKPWLINWYSCCLPLLFLLLFLPLCCCCCCCWRCVVAAVAVVLLKHPWSALWQPTVLLRVGTSSESEPQHRSGACIKKDIPGSSLPKGRNGAVKNPWIYPVQSCEPTRGDQKTSQE